MMKIWSTENLKHLSLFWDREYYIVVMKYAEDSWICSKFVLPLSLYVSRQENKPTTNAMDERPCYPYVSMMTFGWASINAQACFTEHQRFYIKQLVCTPLRTYKQVAQCFGDFFQTIKRMGLDSVCGGRQLARPCSTASPPRTMKMWGRTCVARTTVIAGQRE
jgi:hypothetical protein